MSGTLAPRVVVVSRPSELDELVGRHGTRAAAAHYLRERGRTLDGVVARHERLAAALTEVGAAVPLDWRRGRVDRSDLSRFRFDPEDVVVVVGQDGLVANVARYLDDQPVVGVDPEPGRNPGVLVRWPPERFGRALREVVAGRATVRARAMVRAVADDGQEVLGLNEIYIGHLSHQSARYVLSLPDGRRERQSSSGLVIGTGTGATGWCASIARDRPDGPVPPGPEEPAVTWYVREAWPSPVTGVSLTAGRLDENATLEVTVEGSGLVAFADGVEDDRLSLTWGQRVTVAVARRRLRLVVP